MTTTAGPPKIINACNKVGREPLLGFDDRDHYASIDNLVGAAALLFMGALEKSKTGRKIRQWWDQAQRDIGKQERKKRTIKARPRKKR